MCEQNTYTFVITWSRLCWMHRLRHILMGLCLSSPHRSFSKPVPCFANPFSAESLLSINLTVILPQSWLVLPLSLQHLWCAPDGVLGKTDDKRYYNCWRHSSICICACNPIRLIVVVVALAAASVARQIRNSDINGDVIRVLQPPAELVGHIHWLQYN